MRNSSTLLARCGLVLGLSLVLMGCAREPSAGPSTAPITVPVSKPEERKIRDYSDATGRVAAVDSVEVRPRVWGYIDKFTFKEGALVKKGDVLFEIDPRTYKAALTQAEGNLASAQAKAKRLEADLKRADLLLAKQSISQQDYDKTVSDRGEAVASVTALKGTLEQAKLDLGFTKVTAEVSGRVGRALVTEGNLVQSGQTGATVLTTLVSVDPMYVYFDVDERTVLRVRQLIREGKAKSARDVPLPVYLSLANEEDFPHKGHLDFVDNQVNPKTGTLRIRGVFPNADEFLAPGYFARVRVPIGFPHDALLISDRAIDSDQGQKIVYVVDESNKVAVRPIRLGDLHDGLRVVEDGLKAGERILVTGLQQVRPGQIVEPTLVKMPRSFSRGKTQKNKK